MSQFVLYADPKIDMRVEQGKSTRRMTWDERYAYYDAKMHTIHTYDHGIGRCCICLRKRQLLNIHSDPKSTSCLSCKDCFIECSFRSRALNHGRQPTCAFCRRPYDESATAAVDPT